MALGLALVAGLTVSGYAAEEGSKALPVLLIKGEVVSLDTSDPAAALLKVKDRYGFETPIYVTPDAKITQGDTPVQLASLSTGTTVNVEYNFDVNTAKRHAVSVTLAAQTPAASAPAASSPDAAPAGAPAATPPAPSPAPAQAAPSEPEAASTTP
ncbi:MAG: hypothetical protein HYY59_04815 [Candidatus Omnitrophica bacterium]|nr:hypothetical protein [Candidatus Omnitrophota bacterium]MBI2495859.1 hypothetical protein [Candidatus Omnitrophota bacterium]MBI3021302.1 hypothetical protein [Candidatus Omnitrophota bacterium]